MYDWTPIKDLASEQDFEDYRDLVMCCSVMEHTDDQDLCYVCGGDHLCVERRIRCSSVTCSAGKACPVVWKAHRCSASDAWTVQVNDASHGRGALPCFGEHPTRITAAMKAFFESEVDAMVPPRSIEARLQRRPTIREPRRGWPSIEQIVNALKRIRDENGRRNAIEAIKELVKKRVYTASSEHHPEATFVFGGRLDSNGVPFVAIGYGNEPVVLGVTAPQLLDQALRFAVGSRFVLFHADATFKLSDFTYPVITCGVTDAGRGYQVVALFVVSQRTQRDYALCFRALENLIWQLRGKQLRIPAVMGDADSAQLLGLKATARFSQATPLMCFFHVLYNVRKRTLHLTTALQAMLMTDIVDMHFATSMSMQRWKTVRESTGFAEYFAKQWLSDPFWRIFHTPVGYTATNNPCEVYNASIKKFTQRRRFHMTWLLQKMCDLVETQKLSSPVAQDYAPKSTADIVAAAKRMVASGRTTLHQVAGETRLRVKYTRRHGEEYETSEFGGFVEAFDKRMEISKKDAASKRQGVIVDAEKTKAALLYNQAVSWSLWRSHCRRMPESGWTVDYGLAQYDCK